MRGKRQGRAGQRGSATVTALLVVVGLAILCGAGMTLGFTTVRRAAGLHEGLQAMHLAEAGLKEAVVAMRGALAAGDEIPQSVGYVPPSNARERDIWGGPNDPYNPAGLLHLKSGVYWATMAEVDANVGLYRVTATGVCNRHRRSVSALVQAGGDEELLHAVYAGNGDGDPTYALTLEGLASGADSARGDVYSGGDLVLDDDASVVGGLAAAGTVTGAPGEEGALVPPPDFTGMDYASNHDFDVAALFAADEYYDGSLLGGDAWQVPEENPAHIFRKNPSDRALETGTTAKDDYFLEDPWGILSVDALRDGSAPSTVTLSGDGYPGVSGTGKVYYVDGNLWIHNLRTFSFQIQSRADVEITFAVHGNVYVGDSLWSHDLNLDGVAFVALEDPAHPDSGNVYLGGPILGDLRRFDGFVFAENDVVVENTEAAVEQQPLIVRGSLTAGGRFENVPVFHEGETLHAPIDARSDDRLLDGGLDLPSVPLIQNDNDEAVLVLVKQLASS